MSQQAIRIQNLTKEYPVPRQRAKRTAVQDLTLDVPAGSLFGFLGPNGAGKTTTIKMLLGFVAPTAGKAWLFDKPVDEHSARQRVGYLPEQPYFPKFLSAQETVRAHGGLAGLGGVAVRDRAEYCLRLVGMWDNRHQPLSKCSKGMVQRVGLATALVGDPDLLILDEPASGLDPLGRKELREILARIQEEGKTIFLSSHLLSELETLCDHVGILSRGQLVACGTPNEIVHARDEVAVLIEAEASESLSVDIALIGGQLSPAPSGGRFNLLVPSESVYRALNLVEEKKAKLVSVLPQRESLEDAFLRLVA